MVDGPASETRMGRSGDLASKVGSARLVTRRDSLIYRGACWDGARTSDVGREDVLGIGLRVGGILAGGRSSIRVTLLRWVRLPDDCVLRAINEADREATPGGRRSLVLCVDIATPVLPEEGSLEEAVSSRFGLTLTWLAVPGLFLLASNLERCFGA